MKNRAPIIAVVLSCSLVTGCASGLNSVQSSEYKTWESKGLLVKDKDPGTAAALGILPGGGSFYTGNIGLGVVNLLLWPASILWDPVSGSNGAKSDNYFATKSVVAKKQAAEISELDDKLRLKQINTAEYVKLKRDTEKSIQLIIDRFSLFSLTAPRSNTILVRGVAFPPLCLS